MPGTTRIIPLGGLGEVGKNMTVYEADGEAVVVDAGLAFPRDEHLGVDLILPDFSYFADRERPVRAVLLTHGHEDHVGALPYVLRQARVQGVWATRLTLGLIKSKLDVDGLRTDVGRLAELGSEGVDLLLGDSTNAERPGVTGSERLVGEAFRQIIPLRRGRVLVASFASNVHRMQQAIDVALETGRKVAVVGRSMRKNLNIARNLGYVQVQEDALIRPDDLDSYAPHEVLILCTGSQGEPLSALTRIAYHDHPAVRVERGDTVIISAKPVPGNELRVHDAINRLARAGAEVLHYEIAPVHVSGHANQEEIRMVLGLVRPKAVMPIHGEARMLAAHARMAADAGVRASSIVIAENGSVVELGPGGVRIVDEIEAGVTFVDGLSVGNVSDVALRDRRRLSEDGVLIVIATLTSSNGRVSATPE